MYPNSTPDIMILAHAVSRYFVDKVALLYRRPKSEKGDNTAKNIYWILSKVNKVIYTLDTICEPNSMILDQAVLQIFCWQCCIGLQYKSRKRQVRRERKNYGSIYFSCLFHVSNFKSQSLTVLDRMQNVMDRQMHAQTGPNQCAPSTSSKSGA